MTTSLSPPPRDLIMTDTAFHMRNSFIGTRCTSRIRWAPVWISFWFIV